MSQATGERVQQIDTFWRAANYLGAAQLYLRRNGLLREPLKPEDIKPRLLGHWGTQPGLNLIYAHLDRLVRETDAGVLLVVGPGPGGPAILACAGDVPTTETVAAAWLLERELPELRVRVVNVVDLFSLQTPAEHPHGLDDETFTAMFTAEQPVIFAFHGYPGLIHELVHRRPNARRFHVHGYHEEGCTTTPFDMLVRNEMSRYHLALAALRRVPRLRSHSGPAATTFARRLAEHRTYIAEHDEDMPEVMEWTWSQERGRPSTAAVTHPAPTSGGSVGQSAG